MVTVEFTRTFAAAHRVWNDKGKCRNIHGHNYHASVKVNSNTLNDQNFIIGFDEIKKTIDAFDHTLILHREDPLVESLIGLGMDLTLVDGVPSTEFLAGALALRILETLRLMSGTAFAYHVTVTLRETDSIAATSEAYS